MRLDEIRRDAAVDGCNTHTDTQRWEQKDSNRQPLCFALGGGGGQDDASFPITEPQPTHAFGVEIGFLFWFASTWNMRI